jgi:hypothetical protein
MDRRRRRFAVIVSVVVLIFSAFALFLWVHLESAETPSNIIDFHPTNFQAKADARFFYSIGDELKNSDELSPQAPTLLRGRIKNFLVSPDSTMIAVVANGMLTLVGREDHVVREVAPVASIYQEPKPTGQHFYRDDDFQWSRDSKNLYLLGDEYYDSKGLQLFSSKGELWRYDIQAGSMQLVLKPFLAFNYFFGRNSGIYFSVPTDSGDLQLKYFDGNRVTDVDNPNGPAIHGEPAFFSFSILDYRDIVLPNKSVALVPDQQGKSEKLEIADKPYLTLTQGEGFKGPYYCDDTLRSVFLPGDRYFLFNVPCCGNYNGQLLIDTLSGSYRRLPPDTRVYLPFNTDLNPHYRVTGGGILAK